MEHNFEQGQTVYRLEPYLNKVERYEVIKSTQHQIVIRKNDQRSLGFCAEWTVRGKDLLMVFPTKAMANHALKARYQLEISRLKNSIESFKERIKKIEDEESVEGEA